MELWNKPKAVEAVMIPVKEVFRRRFQYNKWYEANCISLDFAPDNMKIFCSDSLEQRDSEWSNRCGCRHTSIIIKFNESKNRIITF